MRLEAILLADAVEQIENEKISIHGAGITRVTTAELPFAIDRLAVVARLELEPADADQDAELAIKGWHADGTPWFSSPSIPLDRDLARRELLPGEESGIFLILSLDGLVFDREGPHAIQVVANGEALGHLSVAVIRAPDGAVPEG